MIKCEICQADTNFIELHIKEAHADTWTIDEYRRDFPNGPIMSEEARKALDERNGFVGDNLRTVVDVGSTFGVDIGKIKEVRGWQKPFALTPKSP